MTPIRIFIIGAVTFAALLLTLALSIYCGESVGESILRHVSKEW